MSHYQTIKSLGTPIVVHSNLTRFLGSMTASALLSHIIYWSERTDNELGFYRTLKELMFETALTENELRGARKLLVNLGLVQETYKRLEHKLFFKFDSKAFDEWFDEQMAKCENHNCHLLNSQLPPVKTTDGEREIHSSLYTKITTKNTTKTTTESEYDTHTHEGENFQKNSPNETSPSANDLEKLKSTTAKKQSVKDYLISLGVDNQIADDFIYFRKEIKKPLTITAVNRLVTEVNKTDLDINSAIEFTLDLGWQSFTAQYYFNRQSSNTSMNNHQSNNRMNELRQMANTNPTNVFVDDLPTNFNPNFAIGANHE